MRRWVVIMAGLSCVAGCDLDGVEISERIDGRNVGAFGNDHGYVVVELDSEPEVSLEQTREVELRLYYGGCFESFYWSEPRWRDDGERGATVFESALTTDLYVDDLERADGSVLELRQDFGGDPKLRVDYEVRDLAEGQRLFVGPIPTRSLAGCDPDQPVGAGRVEAWGRGNEGLLLWVASIDGVPAAQDTAAALVTRVP